MGKENKLLPKLRFSEFQDNWKIKELDSYIKLLSGYAFKGDDISETKNGIPLLRGINITEGRIRHSKDIDRYYNKAIVGLEKYLLQEDDLVLGMDGSKVGKNVSLISKEDVGSLLIQRVARIRAKDSTDIRFIYLNIFSERFHKYVYKVNTSSGIPHISSKQIKEFSIGFPSLPEQQKIASFLSDVDEVITQLTKKKSLLEQYKKGVMRNIFNQELRFKDDEGNSFPDWEEKNLKQIAKIIGGGTPATTSEEYWNGNINWFTPTEIKHNRVSSSNRKITELGLKKSSATILPIGAILLTTRATIGEVAIATEECTTNQGFQSLIAKTKNLNTFIYYLIKMNKNELYKRANGSTFKEISKKEVEKIRVLVPSLEEQTKIANFLSDIDVKIEALTTKVENSNTFKKGLLQKMFV